MIVHIQIISFSSALAHTGIEKCNYMERTNGVAMKLHTINKYVYKRYTDAIPNWGCNSFIGLPDESIILSFTPTVTDMEIDKFLILRVIVHEKFINILNTLNLCSLFKK